METEIRGKSASPRCLAVAPCKPRKAATTHTFRLPWSSINHSQLIASSCIKQAHFDAQITPDCGSAAEKMKMRSRLLGDPPASYLRSSRQAIGKTSSISPLSLGYSGVPSWPSNLANSDSHSISIIGIVVTTRMPLHHSDVVSWA